MGASAVSILTLPVTLVIAIALSQLSFTGIRPPPQSTEVSPPLSTFRETRFR